MIASTSPARSAAVDTLYAEESVPICVDLDGSLLVTDNLHESLLTALAHRPLALLRAAPRLAAGKAAFKQAVAELATLDPPLLPYNPEVLEYLRSQHAAGRRLALFSAADQSLVERVADHLGLFEHARGSDGLVNLSGERKLAAIREHYGDNFVYLGNADVDVPIWRAAKAALVVGADAMRRKAAAVVPVEASFAPKPGRLAAWRNQLRLHQWAKNLLIFAPIVLAGPLAVPFDFVKGALGFLVFGLLASVGYIVNDLLDLQADRCHATKRLRPFASGRLQPVDGVRVGAAMLLVAGLVTSYLGVAFAVTALGYFVGTLSYSLKLKRVPMLDVLVLACLFTIRVVAGTTLVSAPFSFWLVTFSIFLFLSLALVKRYSELVDRTTDARVLADSRGYTERDLPLLLPFGVGSALAAGLIFVIYLVEEQFPTDIYTQPGWLWFVFPVLMLWLMRIWRLAVHGRMDQDPVLFAVRDRLSLGLGGIVMLLVLLAW